MVTTRQGRTASRKAAVVSGRKKKAKQQAPRTPRSRKPAGMSLEQWQTALRREFGREQKFTLENLGDRPIFSRFRVTNLETGGAYRGVIHFIAQGAIEEGMLSLIDFKRSMFAGVLDGGADEVFLGTLAGGK